MRYLDYSLRMPFAGSRMAFAGSVGQKSRSDASQKFKIVLGSSKFYLLCKTKAFFTGWFSVRNWCF